MAPRPARGARLRAVPRPDRGRCCGTPAGCASTTSSGCSGSGGSRRAGRPSEGTYVRYDHEALIGVLALEAQRAGAVVVGEDLGVVEPSARDYLRSRGILGTSILWFERDDHGDPLPAERWRELCLASVTTHDLPPTAGYLAGDHVRLRDRLGLLTAARSTRSSRPTTRSASRGWPSCGARGLLRRRRRTSRQTVEALHRYLALTPARLLVRRADRRGRRPAHPEPAGHHRRVPQLAGAALRTRTAHRCRWRTCSPRPARRPSHERWGRHFGARTGSRPYDRGMPFETRTEFRTDDEGVNAYRLLTAVVVPRPIAWVTTLSDEGVVNLAPHSFYTVACANPPIVQFTSVGSKDTLRNVQATGEFVVSLAHGPLLEAVNNTSAAFAFDESEPAHLGITMEPSELRQAAAGGRLPRVARVHAAQHQRARRLHRRARQRRQRSPSRTRCSSTVTPSTSCWTRWRGSAATSGASARRSPRSTGRRPRTTSASPRSPRAAGRRTARGAGGAATGPPPRGPPSRSRPAPHRPPGRRTSCG